MVEAGGLQPDVVLAGENSPRGDHSMEADPARGAQLVGISSTVANRCALAAVENHAITKRLGGVA